AIRYLSNEHPTQLVRYLSNG
ncbi:hypothetical protein A2U01_0020496, partial [Trifolium medium]|nr:hypothetical protein [Trifolium medium]